MEPDARCEKCGACKTCGSKPHIIYVYPQLGGPTGVTQYPSVWTTGSAAVTAATATASASQAPATGTCSC